MYSVVFGHNITHWHTIGFWSPDIFTTTIAGSRLPGRNRGDFGSVQSVDRRLEAIASIPRGCLISAAQRHTRRSLNLSDVVTLIVVTHTSTGSAGWQDGVRGGPEPPRP